MDAERSVENLVDGVIRAHAAPAAPASRGARAARVAAAVMFAAAFALLDVFFRGRAAWLSSTSGPLAAVVSVALWSLLMLFATTRARRVALALAFATLLVVQVNVFRYYHAPLDIQSAASALHAWSDVRPILARAAPGLVVALALAFATAYSCLSLVHGASPATRPPCRLRASLLAAVAGAGVALVPPRAATPELRGVHALLALTEKREPRRGCAVSLPPLYSERSELPDVLFILSESVRAEDYDRESAPESARLLPDRVDLAQMRAVSSYTAVSFSALLTGRTQDGPRDEILRAPSLFDFARAARGARGAGRDRPPSVAFLSVQSEEVFEAKDLYATLGRFVTMEKLLGHGPDVPDPALERGVDALLIPELERHLAEVSGPTLAFLHLTDTHAPYAEDPQRTPFRPYAHVPAWTRMDELHNAYRNAIFVQDAVVARAARLFVERARARPWLIVFTSDHGEAFGEHDAIHHGQNLFDEQVHVPTWIAASPGLLAPSQREALASHRGRFVTHLDILPTVLDAMGLWDNRAVAPSRSSMLGRSLLRPYEPRGPIPVTNCTGIFPCPVNTWGLYEDDRKLVARVYDGGWSCLSVAAGGPERIVSAPDPACERLLGASRRTFPLLPNGAPNR